MEWDVSCGEDAFALPCLYSADDVDVVPAKEDAGKATATVLLALIIVDEREAQTPEDSSQEVFACVKLRRPPFVCSSG